MSELPKGWAKAKVDDIAEIQLGKMLDKAKNTGVETPYLGNRNVRWGEFDLSDLSTMRMEPEELEKFLLRDNDLILCEGGEPGRCAVWSYGETNIKYQKALHRLRFLGDCNPYFFQSYFKHYFQSEQAKENFTGTTIMHLPRQNLARVHVVVPPTAEQKRIVEKLDSLSARSSRARDELARIPRLVARYKQAILAAAFQGELTAEWRGSNNSSETAAELLREISIAREQFASRITVGRKPRKIVDMADMSTYPIPPNWAWTSLESLRDLDDNSMTDGPFGSKLKTSHYTEAGVRVVRLGNIGVGEFKADDAFISEDHFKDLTKHEVFEGDLVISALAEPVGRSCQLPRLPGRTMVKADCIRFKPFPLISGRYLMHWQNSPSARTNLESMSHGVGRIRVNLGDLRSSPVPLAPPMEQVEVVRIIDGLFATIDCLAVEHDKASTLLNRLDQAIVAKAFRGELVYQDPSDEPASELLVRIRAERAGATKQKRTRRNIKTTDQTARVPRRKAVMTKSRQDDDVLHRPYLARLLKETGGMAKAEDLFKQSELPVADFYKQLAWELDHGHIRDDQNNLKAS